MIRVLELERIRKKGLLPSFVFSQIGEFLLWVLYWGTNSETDANRFGSISTVLFFILSLQTGLTSLDPEKRLDRLLKNVVLLGTALFHALHQMVKYCCVVLNKVLQDP